MELKGTMTVSVSKIRITDIVIEIPNLDLMAVHFTHFYSIFRFVSKSL